MGTLHKEIDKTSPYFAVAVCQSKRLQKAVIHYYDINEVGIEYEIYRVTLNSIVIMSVNAAHAYMSGSHTPGMMENVAISYSGIEWFYIEGNIKYDDAVSFRVKGASVNMAMHCHFSESSGYNHFGEFELMDVDGEAYWSKVGPGDAANPRASISFTLIDPDSVEILPLAVSRADDFITLLSGKVYGLLSPEEDQQLWDLTVKALGILRGEAAE